MFFHNFKYTLKTLFKNKMLIFWSFAFPIILGTFFQMTFSDIENKEKFNVIPIGIVKDSTWDTNVVWSEAFQVLGDVSSKEQVFSIFYVTKDEAQSLLKSSTIVGYLQLDDTPKITVRENGVEATIFKYVVEEIEETEHMVQNLVGPTMDSSLYSKMYAHILKLKEEPQFLPVDVSGKHLSYTMIEFYTLIAMACLYGGIFGIVVIHQNLANMSSNGKRVSVGSISKETLISSSVLASYLVQLVGIALLFFYTILVLHVDYGEHLFFVILLALVGALAGLSLGIMISCLFTVSENTKTGMMISITMLGCFLAGMMGITMKYIVDKNAFFINLVNPANMITDGFYSLYYYDTFNRYYFDLISLLIFSLLMILVSILQLRRKKYDSI